ncbi:MAG: insulinase family protein [Planctomycetes bacterium]|nr:insulinase family protein [Planctomycetota bacterium]
MNTLRVRLALPLLGLALLSPATVGAEEERTFRKLTLENGLRVVIASDRSVNTSSASLAVGIGANADPKDAQGLAHFLEHMLFLANEKYPTLNAYSTFLKTHGGSSNAYTSQDHTNYHFQVNHDGFPEALDRFAQFFVSPTLDYKYAQREVMAVNSEHQKNTMDDTWRLMQLQRFNVRKGHPASGFSTGNAETLKDAKEEVLRGFFNDYYKPNNMTLGILGNRSLDELEAIVRERFTGIKPGKAKPWTAPSDLLEEAKGLRVFKVAPVKDLRQLKIFFDAPPQQAHALSKIGTLVGMTMGDEGKGSLLSYLKARGLATSLSAGIGGTRYYSSCTVTVGLTPKGLTEWREVLKLSFAYTKMLQTSGVPTHVWHEAKTLAELNHRYGAKPEGTQAVIDLANNALEHGLEIAEKVGITFHKPDPKAYQALVDSFRPENALVFLVGKGLKTDTTEPFYGTQYSSTVETGEAFESLKSVEVPKEIHLPLVNPFVPKDTTLAPLQPVLLQKDAGVTLYYAQDTEFRRPKVAVTLHILSPEAYSSVRAAGLTTLYASILQEQLNEYAYPALMAGLRYSLVPTRKGLLLTVSGYSESALKLLSIVSKAMRGTLDAETFERVRRRDVDGLKNFPLGQAYSVVGELTRKASYQRYFAQSEFLPVLENVKLTDLQAHVKALLAKTHIQGLCAGNLTGAQALEAVAGVRKTLGSAPFDPNQAHKDAILLLKEKEEVVVKRVGDTDQACLRIDYQVGTSDVTTRLSAELFARALNSPFYTEMRTRQKLGYIVFSGTFNRENVQSLVFIIQSGSHKAEDLQARADACIENLPKMFAEMPAAQFDALRESLIQDRKKKVKSIAGRASRFYGSVFDKEGDFDWREKEIAVARTLDQASVLKILRKTISDKTRVVYLMAAKQHGEFKTPGTVKDFAEFTKTHQYVTEKPGR